MRMPNKNIYIPRDFKDQWKAAEKLLGKRGITVSAWIVESMQQLLGDPQLKMKKTKEIS